jgi:ribosome recycling factor
VQTVAAIEKAIADADLGLNPSSDGKVVRAKVPKASAEVRDRSIKQLAEAAETVRGAPQNPAALHRCRCRCFASRTACVSDCEQVLQTKKNIRRVRQQAVTSIKALDTVSSDDIFRMQQEVQEATKQASDRVTEIQNTKRAAISG